jgi:hypothetical protein
VQAKSEARPKYADTGGPSTSAVGHDSCPISLTWLSLFFFVLSVRFGGASSLPSIHIVRGSLGGGALPAGWELWEVDSTQWAAIRTCRRLGA